MRGKGDQDQCRGEEEDRADPQEAGLLLAPAFNRAPISAATAESGPGPVPSGPVYGLFSWNTTTTATATSTDCTTATLIDAFSERIAPANGKRPTMSEVKTTAMSTPTGSRLSAALSRPARAVTSAPSWPVAYDWALAASERLRVDLKQGRTHRVELTQARVVERAAFHLRPVVVNDRRDVAADLGPERVSGGGRQPAGRPVDLPDGNGLVADRLLRRAERLPLGCQRQGKYQQVHRRERGTDEAERHILGSRL